MQCEPVWESMQVNPGPLGQLSLIPWTGDLAADSQEAQLEGKTTGGLSVGDQQLPVPALAKSTQRCSLLESPGVCRRIQDRGLPSFPAGTSYRLILVVSLPPGPEDSLCAFTALPASPADHPWR